MNWLKLGGWVHFMVMDYICGDAFHLQSYGLFWKERNERIFRAKSTSINALIEVVVLRVVKWLLYGNELVDVKLNNILHNWSACTVCGPTIEGKLEAWSPPPRGIELEVQCRWS